MTKHFCDLCKQEITEKTGPIYVGYIHIMSGPMLCMNCFSDPKIWKSLQHKAQKAFDEQSSRHSH